jgi:hypothetical protein
VLRSAHTPAKQGDSVTIVWRVQKEIVRAAVCPPLQQNHHHGNFGDWAPTDCGRYVLMRRNISNHLDEPGTGIGGGKPFQFFIVTLRTPVLGQSILITFGP